MLASLVKIDDLQYFLKIYTYKDIFLCFFIALLFKVIFNNTHFLNHEWFFALELAGNMSSPNFI